jgi:DNA-binding transcriptional LysR family regulator
MQTLALIESFVRSAEAGSFSAAARKLGVTPAAVSKNVATLEAQLGVRLFQRTTRSLALTEPGARFLRDAASGLSTLQTAMESLSDTRERPAGVLRVSMPPLFGRSYILPALGPFLARYPDVTAEWHFDNRQVDLVSEGFDAAIGASLELGSGVVARELARAQLVAVATPGYLKRHPVPKRPEDLSQHDGIMMRSPRTGRVRTWTFRSSSGAEAAFELRPRIVFNDMEAVCHAALAALGIGIIGMPDVVEHLERGDLVRVLPKWHSDAGGIYLYFSSQKLLPAKTRAFVDFIATHFRTQRFAERFRAGG